MILQFSACSTRTGIELTSLVRRMPVSAWLRRSLLLGLALLINQSHINLPVKPIGYLQMQCVFSGAIVVQSGYTSEQLDAHSPRYKMWSFFHFLLFNFEPKAFFSFQGCGKLYYVVASPYFANASFRLSFFTLCSSHSYVFSRNERGHARRRRTQELLILKKIPWDPKA
jgi:hypothetical protein